MKILSHAFSFSLHRGFVVLQLFWTYLLSVAFKKPFRPLAPLSVSIEPANSCNLRCPECPVGNGSLTRAKTFMDEALFTNVVDELSPHISYLMLYFQGEPLLHPSLAKMIQYAHDKKIFTMISTNGQLITNEKARELVNSGLNHLIISLDGITQKVYETYRKGGNLQKTVDAVTYLNAWKKKLQTKTPFIEAQMIVMKHNEHEISAFKKKVNELKVDSFSLKTAQIEWDRTEAWIPSRSRFARYKKDRKGNWTMKKRLKNRCWRQWSSAVISASGDVLPCCFDKNAEHTFGNLRDASFLEIWHNEKAKAFRKAILTNRKQFEMCRNCTS
ncbi:MAG: radical SAM/SPASM domain-containing protein [Microbacter sp.]